MRGIPIIDTFALPEATAAGATAFTAVIPPYRGSSEGQGTPVLYTVTASGPHWAREGGCKTHIDTLLYTTGSTAHKVYICRPFNWTTFSAAVAKNSTAITLNNDPGVYSTAFNRSADMVGYRTPSGNPVAIADNAIAANDYVMFQLDDGTWQLDTIASGTFGGGNLVLTTGTANNTGATIRSGAPLFWFGITTDTDPNTGMGHWATTTIATTNRQPLLQEGVLGGLTSYHKGDPMFFYSPNTSNAGLMNHLSGFYSKR